MKKLSQTSILSMLLFCIGFSTSENFDIFRVIPGEKKNDWKKAKDEFTIPSSICLGGADYCAAFNGEMTKMCYCSCRSDSATFTFHHSQWYSQWSCLGNEDSRRQLGCQQKTFFKGEDFDEKLRVLKTSDEKKIGLDIDDNCKVDLNSSWFIGCHGNRIPLNQGFGTANTDMFTIQVMNSAHYVKIKIPGDQATTNSFRGRIINLGINCTNSQSSWKSSCLLFKLIGEIQCSVEAPTSETSPQSPPTFATLASETPPYKVIRTYVTEPTEPSVTLNTVEDSVKTTAADSPTSGGERKGDDSNGNGDDKSSSVGLIAGVSVSLATLLLVFAVFIFYRRHHSSKSTHTNTDDKGKQDTVIVNPQTNTAVHPDVPGGYVTLGNREPHNYVSNYDVPRQLAEGQEYNPGSQLYTTVDDPNASRIFGPGRTKKPGYQQQSSLSESSGGELNYDPACKEEPLYNILEVPDGSEGSTNYGPGAGPVSEPVYNVLEEEHFQNGAKGVNVYGSSRVQDPVYNVLESPYSAEKEDLANEGPEVLRDPVYSILEDAESNDNENQPVYATVDEQGVCDEGGDPEVYDYAQSPVQWGVDKIVNR